MGHATTPRDLAVRATAAATRPDIGQHGTELTALEAHIRALVAARDGARRALTSARRDRPGQRQHHARELARLARHLTIARRDRARHLRDRGPCPPPPATDPAPHIPNGACRIA
jgi:hypothetical protein